jgi:hypothetical protein
MIISANLSPPSEISFLYYHKGETASRKAPTKGNVIILYVWRIFLYLKRRKTYRRFCAALITYVNIMALTEELQPPS